jgi:hypothetical protein
MVLEFGGTVLKIEDNTGWPRAPRGIGGPLLYIQPICYPFVILGGKFYNVS